MTSPLSELTGEIRLLRAEVSSLKSEFELTINALKRCQIRLDILSNAMSVYESRLSVVEEKVAEIVELTREVDALNGRLNSKAYTLLRNEIEVTGVTEMQYENLHHTILIMSSLIGLKLNDSDVDSVQRAGPSRSASHSLPRPIAVKFTTSHN